MRQLSVLVVTLLVLVLQAVATAAEKEAFPGRSHEKYKDAPYIELEDLHKKFNDVVVVDVRSKFEFDTLQIKGAVNIAVGTDSFEGEIQKLRLKTDKPLVFYCNGHSCMKSYIAALESVRAGVKNVYAYDAGIFDWAKAYPDKAVLLGKSPVDQRDILSKKQFTDRLLNPDKFSDLATDDPNKVIVLDIRDKFQRAGVGFFPVQERWTSLSQMEKVYNYIRQAKEKGKTLFIYDEVGAQVQWLQYALEREGVKNYYFMDKGAVGYYKMISQFDRKDKKK
ncbi:MAG TPA: rhodanese-like domain-containing protein [Gammaproteobacteria bacterium]